MKTSLGDDPSDVSLYRTSATAPLMKLVMGARRSCRVRNLEFKAINCVTNNRLVLREL